MKRKDKKIICQNCGTPYNGGLFCEKCGTRFSSEELNCVKNANKRRNRTVALIILLFLFLIIVIIISQVVKYYNDVRRRAEQYAYSESYRINDDVYPAAVSVVSEETEKSEETKPLEESYLQDDSYQDNMYYEGMYLPNKIYPVGDKIPAGEYIVLANSRYCNIIVRDRENNLIYDETYLGNAYVDLTEGQKIYFSGGNMYDSERLVLASGDIEGGMYKVGEDLDPGKYRISFIDDKKFSYGNEMGYIIYSSIKGEPVEKESAVIKKMDCESDDPDDKTMKRRYFISVPYSSNASPDSFEDYDYENSFVTLEEGDYIRVIHSTPEEWS